MQSAAETSPPTPLDPKRSLFHGLPKPLTPPPGPADAHPCPIITDDDFPALAVHGEAGVGRCGTRLSDAPPLLGRLFLFLSLPRAGTILLSER